MSRTQIILLVFFAHAVAGGGIFTRIPDIQQGLAMSEAMLGLALTTASLGGLAINLVSGRIVRSLGVKPILVIGLPLLSLLSALTAYAPTVPVLFAVILGMGVSFSLTNVAMNVEADRVETASGRRVMNRCHGIWSAGMLTAAVLGVGARGWAVPAGLHLMAFVPLVGLLAATIAVSMSPCPETDGDRSTRPGIALPSRRTFLLVLFGLSGGICQVGTQNFSVIFMRDTFSAPDWVDTLTLPAFLVSMTLGRMFADRLTERFGPVVVAFSLAGFALAGAVLVAAAPGVTVALAGFALIGLGTSVLFPLMISAAARLGARPAAESVSAVIFLTGLVMLAAPALMGWIAETAGLRAAFAAFIPPILLTLLLSRQLAPR
ncbi:MFS transporter [Silicimonas sp. MF1-12-2]|uniref:MFS transporter n=1 Tax=Silicimonas sp. MF1-12-2 TaxID=3384793 RepID=UPI0039B46304